MRTTRPSRSTSTPISPGNALNESQKYGTLELAKIENMRTQAEDLAAGKHVQSTDDRTRWSSPWRKGPPSSRRRMPTPWPPRKSLYGFLAVCAGAGLEAVFRDLGVDGVVSGGQTMNPSTESLLKGVDAIPAETVFILPNNGNIIMAAQQCGALTEKKVVVIPTKTVPQGITAMMNVDFEAPDAQTITDAMTEAPPPSPLPRSPTPPETPISTASTSRKGTIWPWRRASSSGLTALWTLCCKSWQRTPPTGVPPSSRCTSVRM